MERDFMGLNSEDSVIVVKEEILEDCQDSGEKYAKCSSIPWPLSNNVSAFPHFMSFKDAQYEKMSKQQCLEGVPVAFARSMLPSSGFVPGTTESCTKAAPDPTQMTIFDAGAVNAFDAINPEKAQAIMSLAGYSCLSPNMSQTRLPILAPPAKLAAGDDAFGNRIMLPCSVLSSPIRVMSHPVGLVASRTMHTNEVKNPKIAEISVKTEPLNMMASITAGAASTVIPCAIPQFLKASQARFWVKRKERARNSAPYKLGKKSTGKSNMDGLSEASAVGSMNSPWGLEHEIKGLYII